MATNIVPIPFQNGAITPKNVSEMFTIIDHTLESSATFPANDTKTSAATVTNEGYYPLGIVGFRSSNTTGYLIPYWFRISSVAVGSCTASMSFANRSSSAQSSTIHAYILWVKAG